MDFLAVANDGSIWIKSLRVDGVTLAAVDDAGLPYRVSPGKEFFYKYNFSDWSNLSTPLIILVLFSAWVAVYLENFNILFASSAAGISFIVFPPFESGRYFIVFTLTGGLIGSLIGGRVKTRKAIESKLPTTIGFIIGALFGLGGLYLTVLLNYPA
jgi:hypothetical protein